MINIIRNTDGEPMYTTMIKWTPNSSNARYMPFAEIEQILSADNLKDGTPIVAAEHYNREIYTAWYDRAMDFRNYFLTSSGIDYFVYQNDQGTVISTQIMASEGDFNAVTNQSFYNEFLTARQNFANLINVSFEIKRTSTDIGIIDSFSTAEAMFNLL